MDNKVARKKIEWLQYCLEIGWKKDQLSGLSDAWDKYYDENGKPQAAKLHAFQKKNLSSLTPKSISGVFVKYSERKPFVNGEYLCRFLTHLPVGLHGAEYLQYDKEEGGFMVEHNDYAKLEWFDESITDPKSIRDSDVAITESKMYNPEEGIHYKNENCCITDCVPAIISNHEMDLNFIKWYGYPDDIV